MPTSTLNTRFQPADRLTPIQEYYFSRKLKEIEALRAAGKAVINLGIGSPDLPPAESVIQRLQHSAAQESHHAYQSYQGVLALRQAFSDWYLRVYGVQLDPTSEVLPLAGSKEGIMHISMAFLDSRSLVAVPNPGYPTYAAAAQLAGASLIDYDPIQPDWKEMAAAIKTHRTSDASAPVLFWLNYPHMPTGFPGNLALFSAWVDFAHQHNVMLVHDNPYSLILHDNPISLLAVDGAREVALELNSLSKSHQMAGWRIGVLMGDANALQTVLRFKSQMDSGMFLPLQHAAIEALAQPASVHESINEVYAERRVWGLKILEHLGCQLPAPQSGMFLWGKIPNAYPNAYALSDQLLNNTAVFLTPGGIFGSRGESYLRLSLCSSTRVLQTAFERIVNWTLTSAKSCV